MLQFVVIGISFLAYVVSKSAEAEFKGTSICSAHCQKEENLKSMIIAAIQRQIDFGKTNMFQDLLSAQNSTSKRPNLECVGVSEMMPYMEQMVDRIISDGTSLTQEAQDLIKINVAIVVFNKPQVVEDAALLVDNVTSLMSQAFEDYMFDICWGPCKLSYRDDLLKNVEQVLQEKNLQIDDIFQAFVSSKTFWDQLVFKLSGIIEMGNSVSHDYSYDY